MPPSADPCPDPLVGPPDAATAHALVRLDELCHSFGDSPALSKLSFEVPEGRITVLLGPNGAGKTTAFRAITGALVPTSGHVRTFGLDPDADGHLVRPRCGVVSAKPALYDRLSGLDNLLYSAHLYSVEGDLVATATAAAERFGIADALDQAVGGYSTGMKTRLALARSILHDPELLLFDEPTSGLDPESSHAVLDLIRELTDEGRTVVMCTHLLAEAEGLADHVVMMEAGTAVLSGSPDELTSRFWPHPVVHLDAEDPRVLDRLASWPGVEAYRREPAGARLELRDMSTLPGIVTALCADGARLTRVEPHSPTLEDLYFIIRRGLGATAPEGALAPIRGRGKSPGTSPAPPVLGSGAEQLPSLPDPAVAASSPPPRPPACRTVDDASTSNEVS